MDRLTPLLLLALSLGSNADHCLDGDPVVHFDINKGQNPSVYDDLTTEEITEVYDFMKAWPGFGEVKEADMIRMDSTYVYHIERREPPKAEVLAYLEHRGPKPQRNAWVVMFRGDLTPPVIEEYEVGPLPGIKGLKKLSIAGKDSLEYMRRPLFAPADFPAWDSVILRETAKVDHILHRVTGYTFNNCTDRCLKWLIGAPAQLKTGIRTLWINALKNVEGLFLHPLGLQFRIDTGQSLSTDSWQVDKVWFRGAMFNSFDELAQESYENAPVDSPVDASSKDLYSTLNQRGIPFTDKKQRGPVNFMPDGRRYTVDGHHIAWQGWTFDFSLRALVGIQVHDARFKEQRVAYALSLSEMGIVYSGASPLPLHSAFIDSPFYFGLEAFELVPGIDCPDHATYFDFAHFTNFQATVHKKSACLFELDRGLPIRRHFHTNDKGGHYVQGMPGNVLVLRSAVTVYNYEYIIDHIFHQNGVLEVAASLSGYLLSSYLTGSPEEKERGFEVAPGILGQIHNHMLQFKVDLDIGQTKNRFSTLDVKIDTITDPADTKETMYAQKFEHHLRETEMDATYKSNFDTPKYLIFSDNDQENKYGNKKGYRLLPVHMNKQMMPEDWPLEKGASWERYQVVVTKQKDSERRGSSIYNLVDFVEPVVTFSSFFEDNESIVDEDLVAWVTLGIFHIPSSEDVPIVQTPSHSLTFYLLPYNYYDEDPSLASNDNVRFTRNADGSTDREGASEDVHCEPKSVKLRSSGAATWTLPQTTMVVLLTLATAAIL